MIGWETWGTILESPDSKSGVLPVTPFPNDVSDEVGWGGWIQTTDIRFQRPAFYR